MLIEEIIRSCANPNVAHAAVASIGPGFTRQIATAASAHDMGIGDFVTSSIDRFARHGDEGELRAVRGAMASAQEPLLAGLHHILCITLADDTSSTDRQIRTPVSRKATRACSIEGAGVRRERYS